MGKSKRSPLSSILTFFIRWIKFILNFWLSTHLFSNSCLIILLLPGHHSQTLPGPLVSQGLKWHPSARVSEVGPGSHALHHSTEHITCTTGHWSLGTAVHSCLASHFSTVPNLWIFKHHLHLLDRSKKFIPRASIPTQVTVDSPWPLLPSPMQSCKKWLPDNVGGDPIQLHFSMAHHCSSHYQTSVSIFLVLSLPLSLHLLFLLPRSLCPNFALPLCLQGPLSHSSVYWSNPGILNLGSTDIWSQIIFYGGDLPMCYCRTLSITPGQ